MFTFFSNMKKKVCNVRNFLKLLNKKLRGSPQNNKKIVTAENLTVTHRIGREGGERDGLAGLRSDAPASYDAEQREHHEGDVRLHGSHGDGGSAGAIAGAEHRADRATSCSSDDAAATHRWCASRPH
jgi:hypothetical protein